MHSAIGWKAPALAALVLAGGLAQAATPLRGIGNAGLTAGIAPSVDHVVDVAGFVSYGAEGDPGNVVLSIDVGANTQVTGIGWDVSVTAYSPSWLSELTVSFLDSTQSAGVYLSVGVGDTFGGSAAYSSGGVVDLIGLGLAFNVGADGVLRLEFHESFDDDTVIPDGLWESGALTIQTAAIPEPGTYGLMALGLLAVGAAARRRAAH